MKWQVLDAYNFMLPDNFILSVEIYGRFFYTYSKDVSVRQENHCEFN